jgi:hypothetical protein
MTSTTRVRPAQPHAAAAPVAARRGPHLNALKHGLRSGSVLLPGDDVAAFRTLRQRLFHLYQPRTVEEAQCVETIAASHWRIARCRVEQAAFKRHLGAVLSGDPDATGYVCAPDPHALHHRSMDCVLEEARLEKFKSKAQASLALLQQQRTQSLTVGTGAALEDYRVFLAEGEPLVEEDAPLPATPAGEAQEAGGAERHSAGATGSQDGKIRKIRKRDSTGPALGFPQPWSRRQQQAPAARRGVAAGINSG